MGQGCPLTGTRNKFQLEFAFTLEPERFGINFSFPGTAIPKSQINFVHERFFAVNRLFSVSSNLFAACAISNCRKRVCICVSVQTSRTDRSLFQKTKKTEVVFHKGKSSYLKYFAFSNYQRNFKYFPNALHANMVLIF